MEDNLLELKGMTYPFKGKGMFFSVTFQGKKHVVFLPTEDIPESQIGRVVQYTFDIDREQYT